MYAAGLVLFVLVGCAYGAAENTRLLAQPPVRICSFNVQVFGRSKMKKPIVPETLLKILPNYDITTIQEIRDSSQTAFPDLVARLNAASDVNYDFVVSARLGRTVSKEQYGFIYRTDRVTLLDTYQFEDGEDTGADAFEREPFAARFKVAGSDVEKFSIISVHTKPEHAVEETDRLAEVYDAVAKKWKDENSIIAGDFNADCNFVRADEWVNITLWTDKRFKWVTDRCMDTTVKRTDCAYDRFVVAGEKLQKAVIPKSPKVVRFDDQYTLTYDEAKTVSDHYPIEMQLKGKAIRGVQTNLETYMAYTIAEKRTATEAGLAGLADAAPKLERFDITVTQSRGQNYEVVAFADRIRNLATSMEDFRQLFPQVISEELERAFQSFALSESFKSPYVYGLKMSARKTFDMEIRCGFKTFECIVTAHRRLS